MTFDPKTNRVPWGLLTGDERKALADCEGPFESWDWGGSAWFPDKPFGFSGAWRRVDTIIRQSSPYTGIWMSRQLLDVLDPKWQWFARYKNGDSYCFEEKPFLTASLWRDQGKAYFLPIPERLLGNHHFDPGTCDWQDSLVSLEELKRRAGDRP